MFHGGQGLTGPTLDSFPSLYHSISRLSPALILCRMTNAYLFHTNLPSSLSDTLFSNKRINSPDQFDSRVYFHVIRMNHIYVDANYIYTILLYLFIKKYE